MSGKKIYILTEGGGNKGMGHISRCVSLAEAFAGYGHQAQMIVKGSALNKASFNGIPYKEFDWIIEYEKAAKEIEHTDLLVIDSYDCPEEIYYTFSNAVQSAAYIDDDFRIDYPEGFMINGVMCAEQMNHTPKENVRYLLGINYSFLRKDFWNIPQKEIKDEIHSVLITCGGNDVDGLSYRVLKVIAETYPSLQIKVILKNRDTQHLSFYEKHATVLTDLSAAEMLAVMMEADLAITASGQTTYELCRTGTPFIALVTAENQLFSIGCFYKNGLVMEPLNATDKMMEQKMIEQFTHLSEVGVRKKISTKMKEAIDGQGSLRVVKYLLEHI